jgi:hypothetical protein
MGNIYNRLGYNFDTARFGGATTMVNGSANTLNLIANSTPKLNTWQKQDLGAGAISRTTYFKNPVAPIVNSMISAVNTLKTDSTNTGDGGLSGAASSCLIELNAFKSHTDNISGVTLVTAGDVPSYDSASSVGQMNMQTLTGTEGVPANTIPILGSFTSLFITDILTGHNTTIVPLSSDYNGSITANTQADPPTYTSNYGDTSGIVTDLGSLQNILYTSRMRDWNFYRNSVQLAKDQAFLQQFNSMGGTNSYLIKNVIGTPSLIAKLNSQNQQ